MKIVILLFFLFCIASPFELRQKKVDVSYKKPIPICKDLLAWKICQPVRVMAGFRYYDGCGYFTCNHNAKGNAKLFVDKGMWRHCTHASRIPGIEKYCHRIRVVVKRDIHSYLLASHGKARIHKNAICDDLRASDVCSDTLIGFKYYDGCSVFTCKENGKSRLEVKRWQYCWNQRNISSIDYYCDSIRKIVHHDAANYKLPIRWANTGEKKHFVVDY